MTPAHLAFPGNVLRAPVPDTDVNDVGWPAIREIAMQLFALMYASPGGVGLAANMAGLDMRIIVAQLDSGPLAMVNPYLVEIGDKRSRMTEANLCVPGYYAPVSRPARIVVSALALDGGSVTTALDGWPARIVLHELSVLDGEPFLDLAEQAEIGDSRVAPSTMRSAKSFIADSAMLENLAKGMQMHYFNAVTLSPDLLGLRQTVLRKRAEPVDFDQWTRQQLDELVKEMFWLQHHLEGVGLAAPQIGFSVRLAVIDNQCDPALVLVNPEIVERSEETETANEGCLSLPGYRGPVMRAKEVRVTGHTLDGRPTQLQAAGFLARIIQHEVDHLDGILYADRLAEGAALEAVDPDTLAERAVKAVMNSNRS